MPYLGRTSFLHNREGKRGNYCFLCQCPISGALHFYILAELISTTDQAVSMPYLGRTSFLRKWAISAISLQKCCVNALSRAHFISTPARRPTKCTLRAVCQCPISGALHFYCTMIIPQTRAAMRVNALSRAHFISTMKSYKCVDGRFLCQCPISGALHFY